MAANLTQISASSEFTGQDVKLLEDVFRTVEVTSCPYILNFHMHTVCSDGQLIPQDVVKQAATIGLKDFAITDHHTLDGYYQAKQWLQNAADNSRSQLSFNGIPRLWTGVEINGKLLNTEVHILCYAFNPDHDAIRPYLQRHPVSGAAYHAQQIIDAAHSAGGLAVLAHPARYRKSPQELIPEAVAMGLDGVEVYYAYDNPFPWRASPQQTQEIDHLSHVHNLLRTCGTNTHGTSLLRRV